MTKEYILNRKNNDLNIKKSAEIFGKDLKKFIKTIEYMDSEQLLECMSYPLAIKKNIEYLEEKVMSKYKDKK